MKARFKVNDEFRLKKDETFTRSFPVGGYNKDGFAELSQASDAVLTIQVGRLKKLIESRSPENH